MFLSTEKTTLNHELPAYKGKGRLVYKYIDYIYRYCPGVVEGFAACVIAYSVPNQIAIFTSFQQKKKILKTGQKLAELEKYMQIPLSNTFRLFPEYLIFQTLKLINSCF